MAYDKDLDVTHMRHDDEQVVVKLVQYDGGKPKIGIRGTGRFTKTLRLELEAAEKLREILNKDLPQFVSKGRMILKQVEKEQAAKEKAKPKAAPKKPAAKKAAAKK